MRFESLLWSVLAMFLVWGATWEKQSLGLVAPSDPTYQAAEGGTDIPPPRP